MSFTRREFLLSTAALTSCRAPLARPFNGYAFVANRESRTISAVNLSKFKVSKQIPLEAEPASVIVAPSTQRVFALLPDSATVVEIDCAKLAAVRKRRVGGRAVSMLLDAAGESIWILCHEPSEMVQLGLRDWKARTAARLPRPATQFDLSPSAPLAALDNPPSIVNLHTGSTEHSLAIEGGIGIIRFRPDGRQILAGHAGANMISIADPTTGRLVVQLPLAIEPERFCFTHDGGGQMFVTGRGMDAVVIVSPYQTTVLETILAGRAPDNMAVNADYLFVANPETGDLTVISIADRSVIARVPVGQEPAFLLLTPDDQYLLVLNRKSGDVAVMRVSKIIDPANSRYKRGSLFTLIPVGSQPVGAAVCSF